MDLLGAQRQLGIVGNNDLRDCRNDRFDLAEIFHEIAARVLHLHRSSGPVPVHQQGNGVGVVADLRSRQYDDGFDRNMNGADLRIGPDRREARGDSGGGVRDDDLGARAVGIENGERGRVAGDLADADGDLVGGAI